MKKLLIILLCLPFLFNSCKKEEEDPINTNNSGSSNSQICGNVIMNVNYLVNETFNNNQYDITCNSSLDKVNGVFTEIYLSLYFNCSTLVPVVNIPTLVPIRSIILSYYPTLNIGNCSYDEYNCNFDNTNYFSTSYYTNGTATDSIIVNLTNIDEINYKVSGDFSIIDLSGNKPNIDVVFSDIPISINTK